MSTTHSVSTGALYYPYIHIKDINWLKANLLISPCIKRMLPLTVTPQDGDFAQFTRQVGNREPILQPANLHSPRSLAAQAALAEKIRRDSNDKSFLKKYGRKTARALIGDSDPSSQIHVDKLSYELKSALLNENLPEENEARVETLVSRAIRV